MKFTFSLLPCVVLLVSATGCSSFPEIRHVPPAPVAKKLAVLKSLAGTSWTLRELGGEPVNAGELAGDPAWPALSLEFRADGLGATGHGGLNRFGGRYSEDGSKLAFGPLAMTRRAGPPALMELEHRYTQALTGVVEWRQEDTRLVLIGAGARRLAVFERVPAAR